MEAVLAGCRFWLHPRMAHLGDNRNRFRGFAVDSTAVPRVNTGFDVSQSTILNICFARKTLGDTVGRFSALCVVQLLAVAMRGRGSYIDVGGPAGGRACGTGRPRRACAQTVAPGWPAVTADDRADAHRDRRCARDAAVFTGSAERNSEVLTCTFSLIDSCRGGHYYYYYYYKCKD